MKSMPIAQAFVLLLFRVLERATGSLKVTGSIPVSSTQEYACSSTQTRANQSDTRGAASNAAFFVSRNPVPNNALNRNRFSQGTAKVLSVNPRQNCNADAFLPRVGEESAGARA
jgi:hypothetical protein